MSIHTLCCPSVYVWKGGVKWWWNASLDFSVYALSSLQLSWKSLRLNKEQLAWASVSQSSESIENVVVSGQEQYKINAVNRITNNHQNYQLTDFNSSKRFFIWFYFNWSVTFLVVHRKSKQVDEITSIVWFLWNSLFLRFFSLLVMKADPLDILCCVIHIRRAVRPQVENQNLTCVESGCSSPFVSHRSCIKA